MKFLKWLANWLRKRGWLAKEYDTRMMFEHSSCLEEKISCSHGKTEVEAEYVVFGRPISLMHSPMCHSCTTKALNRFSTLCAACLEPILPGTSVGLAWQGAPHPFTHLSLGCCESFGLYCGVWGEGRLFTLHEVNSQKYAKNATTVMGQVFSSGKPVSDVIP